MVQVKRSFSAMAPKTLIKPDGSLNISKKPPFEKVSRPVHHQRILMPEQPTGYIKAPRFDFF